MGQILTALNKFKVKNMRYIYNFLFYLIVPFALLRLVWLSRKSDDYRKRFAERFGFFKVPKQLKNVILLHAVSVGETLSAVPFIKALQKQYPDKFFVVTTMTVTGSARVKSVFGDSVFHVYLPYDLPCVMKRFLNKLKPKIVIVMETEIWPNLLYGCNLRNIPVLLCNARLSKKSLKYYLLFNKFFLKCLNNIDVIAAQSKFDADRFLSLGVFPKRLKILGNIKFDMEQPKDSKKNGIKLREQLGKNRHILLAGSTHENEEKQILTAYKKIKLKYPKSLLILVPRHPERFNEVAKICEGEGFEIVRRSMNDVRCSQKTDIYLGDTMGEMMTFCAACNVAFVGGSLVKTGGHNVLEPALFSLPIITGSYIFNFQKIIQLLVDSKALTIVENPDELAKYVIEFFRNPKLSDEYGKRAYQVVLNNRGSLEKHLALVADFLGD